MGQTEEANFQIFRDCLATPLIEKSATEPKKPKTARVKAGRKSVIKLVSAVPEESNDAGELAGFIDASLPSLKSLLYPGAEKA